MASSQNLALKTPKRLEALFLTLSGHELLVKAAYYRYGAMAGTDARGQVPGSRLTAPTAAVDPHGVSRPCVQILRPQPPVPLAACRHLP